MQDRITSSVAGTIEPTVQEEKSRARCVDEMAISVRTITILRALAPVRIPLRRSPSQACCDTLAPRDLARPAFCSSVHGSRRVPYPAPDPGLGRRPARERHETLDLVERGLQADRHDPSMLGAAGHCFAWFGHDIGKGLAYIDEALEINPNNAHGFLQSGVVRTRAGQLEKAREHLERALRLSPRDVRGYAYFQAVALNDLLAGRTQEAREWALRAVQHNANYAPGWYVLAASEGVLGEKAKTKEAVDRLLALDPTFSIRGSSERLPTKGPEVMKPLVDGLRLAGLPE